MAWYYYLIAFVAFWLLRALFYYTKLRQIRSLKTKYYDYLKNTSFEFLQNKSIIIDLFKQADLNDFSVTHVEAITQYEGQVNTISGFGNLSNTRSDIVAIIKSKFEETIGVFQYRMKQSFNPFYWAEFILKLPQFLLSYINLSPPPGLMNVIQLMYWIAMVVLGLHTGKVIDITSWL